MHSRWENISVVETDRGWMARNVIYEPSLSPFKYCSVGGFLTPKSSLCCFSFEKHAFGSFSAFLLSAKPENRPWGQNYVVCCLLDFLFLPFLSLSFLVYFSLSLLQRLHFFPNKIFIDKNVEKKAELEILKEVSKIKKKKLLPLFMFMPSLLFLPTIESECFFLLLQHAHNFKSFSWIQLIYLLFY